MKTYQNLEIKVVLRKNNDVITGSYELPEVDILFGESN